MKIFASKITVNKKSAVLSAEIEYKNGEKNVLFFETEKKFQSYLAADLSPFFASLFLIAMQTGEDIVIEGSVSKKLFRNAQKIMDLFLSWNVGFKRISVKVVGYTKEKKKKKNVGLFFSGGVDSLYTFLKNRKQITHLIFVHGMDIRLHEKKLYKASFENVKKVADREGVVLIPIRTNMRALVDSYVPWKFGHGSILASIALALSGGLSDIFISGGMYKKALRPYGTHPALDHLWSTEAVTIKHFGHHVDRLAKISFLARSPKSIERLRVCWVNTGNAYNCGKCEKCLRTMISLYTAGVLHKSKTFPKEIDPLALKRLYIDEKNHYRYFRENLAVLKKERRSPEIIRALEQCLQNNEKPKTVIKVYRNIRRATANIDAKYFQGGIFMLTQKRLGGVI